MRCFADLRTKYRNLLEETKKVKDELVDLKKDRGVAENRLQQVRKLHSDETKLRRKAEREAANLVRIQVGLWNFQLQITNCFLQTLKNIFTKHITLFQFVNVYSSSGLYRAVFSDTPCYLFFRCKIS